MRPTPNSKLKRSNRACAPRQAVEHQTDLVAIYNRASPDAKTYLETERAMNRARPRLNPRLIELIDRWRATGSWSRAEQEEVWGWLVDKFVPLELESRNTNIDTRERRAETNRLRPSLADEIIALLPKMKPGPKLNERIAAKLACSADYVKEVRRKAR